MLKLTYSIHRRVIYHIHTHENARASAVVFGVDKTSEERWNCCQQASRRSIMNYCGNWSRFKAPANLIYKLKSGGNEIVRKFVFIEVNDKNTNHWNVTSDCNCDGSVDDARVYSQFFCLHFDYCLLKWTCFIIERMMSKVSCSRRSSFVFRWLFILSAQFSSFIFESRSLHARSRCHWQSPLCRLISKFFHRTHCFCSICNTAIWWKF